MCTVVNEDVRNVVRRIGKDFERLNGKNILITGGTGFVGTHLLEALAFVNDHILDNPCQVFVVARRPQKLQERCPYLVGRKDLALIQGDIRNFKVPAARCDFIIHAASPADPRVLARDPLETMDVIVEGTRNVLNLAAERDVERFLFLSSGAVYGPQPSELKAIPEDYLGGPNLQDVRASYGEAKRLAEVLCQVFMENRGVPVLVARLFAFVGPHIDVNSSFAVTEFIRHGLRGQPISVKGDGRAVRTLCYSADMTVALWAILLCAEKGDIYNVGSDRDLVSIEELAYKVSEKVGMKGMVYIEDQELTDSVRPQYVPDITKLKKHFGYSLEYDLDTSLTRTVKYLMKSSQK